jgi:hypothetical protein
MSAFTGPIRDFRHPDWILMTGLAHSKETNEKQKIRLS